MQIRPNLTTGAPPLRATPREKPVDTFASAVPETYRGYKWTAALQVPHPIASQTYYDAAADAKTAQAYYGDLPTDPKGRFGALRQLVTRTHSPLEGG